MVRHLVCEVAQRLDLWIQPPMVDQLDRIDERNATAGPASVVVRVREGAPWPITVRVAATRGSSFTKAQLAKRMHFSAMGATKQLRRGASSTNRTC